MAVSNTAVFRLLRCERYRSEVLYCAEDDIHFANLSVKDTMDFAMRVRKPYEHSEPATHLPPRT